MKYVAFSSFCSIFILAVTSVGCRTTNPGAVGSESGLSEVAVPLPDEVAKNLDKGGRALLHAVDAKTNRPRTFEAVISSFGQSVVSNPGQQTSVTFDVDIDGEPLKINDALSAIKLELVDEGPNVIYTGQSNPSQVTLGPQATELNFELTCASTAAAIQKCNGQPNIEIVAIQGRKGTTSASIKANISIKSDGITFEQRRSTLVECLQAFEAEKNCYTWDGYAAGGEDTCKDLLNFKNQRGISKLSEEVANISNNRDLNIYQSYCEKLGLIKVAQ